MTNKELIDHCNEFWDTSGHYCIDCPYVYTYCTAFMRKCRDTPYHCDTYYDGEYYTDEEIKYEN